MDGTIMIKVVTTLLEGGKAVTSEESLSFSPDAEGVEKEVINLYPDVEYQEFFGFGGALTESAGYVFSYMDQDAQDEILEAYYGKTGIGYRFGRTHLDSCDFSLGNYSAVTDAEDAELNTFTLERDLRYIIPLIKRVNAAAGEAVPLMLTPWSPPAFMKTNGDKNNGGSLKKEFAGLWARYICRYICEYRAQGINVTMLTPQNEPKALQTWDSCVYTAEEEREFIREYLAPELKNHGLSDVGIFIWDHNKERAYDRACEVISDGEMDSLVSGVALHWYSGDHFEALEMIKKRFPDKRLLFSEACVEYLVHTGGTELSNARMYAHEIIGDVNAGLDTFFDWNIILDERGGPNHVNNFCDAPILCDMRTKTFRKNLSYHYIGHFSRYIEPGAVRIGFSRFTGGLEMTALKNPSGSLVAVVMNPSDREVSYYLRLNGEICRITSAGDSIMTILID